MKVKLQLIIQYQCSCCLKEQEIETSVEGETLQIGAREVIALDGIHAAPLPSRWSKQGMDTYCDTCENLYP